MLQVISKWERGNSLPDVLRDLYEDTVLEGFSQIDSVIGDCWYTDDDESSIADLARSLRVN